MQNLIKTLTLEEILHYGGLGELKITTDEDWEHLTELIRESQEINYLNGKHSTHVNLLGEQDDD